MKQIKIIREQNLIDFENIVNQLLSENWQIIGNFNIDKEDYLYQMLVKN